MSNKNANSQLNLAKFIGQSNEC